MIIRSRYSRSETSRSLRLESLEARHPMAAYISELQLALRRIPLMFVINTLNYAEKPRQPCLMERISLPSTTPT